VRQHRVSWCSDGRDGCEGNGTETATQRGLFGRSPASESYEQLGLGCAPSRIRLSVARSVPSVWVRSRKGLSVTAILPRANSTGRQGPVYPNGAPGGTGENGL